MKDITSTSFGLVIAFLLPGLVGFLSLIYWSKTIKDIFTTFLSAESNVGLFLLVILIALIIGLIVTVLRWLIYEHFRSDLLDAKDFAAIGSDEIKLAAFRAAVDEHYRYHQFWGGMTIVLPLFVIGWIINNWNTANFSKIIFISLLSILLEAVMAAAAVEAYKRYVSRARFIMKGE
jgi:hypothetical protein